MKKTTSKVLCLRYRHMVIAGAISFSGLAGASDLFNASQTICVSEATQEQRQIELIYQSSDSPIPCTLHYEKDGAREEVASAKNTKGHCEKIERKMVRNLVSSGWQCQHSFLGDLGLQEKSDITLDLFSQPEISSTLVPGTPSVEARDEHNDNTAQIIANGLKANIEDEYITDLQERIQQDFADALGAEYLVDVTVKLDLDVSISPLSDNYPDKPDIVLLSEADTVNTVPIIGRYTLSSQAFDNEQDAHRFAAEFHTLYPDVYSRVGQFDDGLAWRLVLGMDNNQEKLNAGIAQLDASTQRYFDVLESESSTADHGSLVWVPDDWARYAVASCYAKGHTTSLELAECADVVLDVDSFLACLAGGICIPERFSTDLTPQQIDFVEVVGSDDPVAAARGILINDIQGCENLGDPGSKEAAECVALSILDDDQRQMYNCYQRTDEQLDLIACVGDETVADNLVLYERCAIDTLTMTECLMAEVNNEHLNSAARCVNFGETDAILACAIDANIDTDQSRVLACMSDSSARSDQAQCLSREYLDSEQAALLDCARGDMSEADFGLCVADQRGLLTGDEYRAAECLLAGETEPNSLLNCAGARFASNELNQCLDASIPLSDCFTTETVISEVVANNMDGFIDIDAVDNQIALFRADLYALEGGDLADVLSDETSAQLFATTEEIITEVKKKGSGLLKKLGF